MSLVVHCGQCEKRYEVADELVGRTFRCKDCGAPIVTKRVSAEPVSPKSADVVAVKADEAKPAQEKPRTLAAGTESKAKPSAADRSAEKPARREKSVEQPKPAASKGSSRPVEYDQLEIVEDKPLKASDFFELDDDGDEDEIEEEERVVARPRRSESRRPPKRTRSEKSNRSHDENSVAPKVMIAIAVVAILGIVGWGVFAGVRSLWNRFQDVANRYQKNTVPEICEVQMPGNTRHRFWVNQSSNAFLSELSGTSSTAELQCSTVKWQRAVGADMDSARILASVRERWVVPWGATEKDEAIEHQGLTGREFHGSSDGREAQVRVFVNRQGLIVLRVRNLPGKMLAAKERDDFFAALNFNESFLKALPVGTRVEAPRSTVPRETISKVLAEQFPTENARNVAKGTAANTRVKPANSGSGAPIAKETIEEVSTTSGTALRVTRGFEVTTVSAAKKNPAVNRNKSEGGIKALEWAVTVDPPREIPEYDVSTPLNMIIPAAKLPQSSVVVFANSGSPCVLAGIEGKDRVAWNLATRQKLGTLPAKTLKHTPIAISPDGKWIAGISESSDAATIWNVATGKVQAEWSDTQFSSGLQFVGSSRLLGDVKRPVIYDIEDGKQLCQLKPSTRNALACSPGGQFLAVVMNSEVLLFDTSNGRQRGRLNLGTLPFAAHLAFTPDGTVLGIAIQSGAGLHFSEIDLEDGHVRRQFGISDLQDTATFNPESGVTLQGLPGNRGWLFGDRSFVSSELEGVAWTFETLRSFSHRHQTAIAATEKGIIRLAPDPKGGKLVFEPIGSRVLDAKKEDVQLAVDALLPPLTQADWSQVRELLPASQPKWNVPRDVQLEGSVPTPTLTFELGSRFTRGAALAGKKQLAVLCQPSGPPPTKTKGAKTTAPKDSEFGFTLELYDVAPAIKKTNPAPAKPTRQVTIPFPCDLVDVSPSARFALVRAGQSDANRVGSDRTGELTGRLDVIDLQSGQHVVGWRPFFDLFQQAIVAQSAFVDDEHVLTLSEEVGSHTGSLLVLWKIPECRAEYVIQGVSTRTLSPDRRVLGISRELDRLLERGAALKDEPRGLFLFDVLSGATLGHLKGGTTVTHAVFHPREPRLFALTQGEATSIAIEWDLQSGKILREFPLPFATNESAQYRQLAWTASNQLLVNGQMILDLKREIYSASLRTYNIVFVPQNFDARSWFMGEINSSNHLIGLGASELPDAKMTSTIQLAMPKPDLLLQPGVRVSLAFELPALSADVAAEVRKRVRDQLELLQVEIADQQEIVIRVVATEAAGGGAIAYDPSPRGMFGRRDPKENVPVASQSINERNISCKFQILRNDQVEQEFHGVRGNRAWFVTTRGNQTVQQVADDSMHSGAKQYLMETRLPPFIFSKKWQAGMTAWQLSPKGIEQQPNFGVLR